MYTNALKKHSTPFANWFIGKLLFAIKKSTFNNSNTKKYTAKKSVFINVYNYRGIKPSDGCDAKLDEKVCRKFEYLLISPEKNPVFNFFFGLDDEMMFNAKQFDCTQEIQFFMFIILVIMKKKHSKKKRRPFLVFFSSSWVLINLLYLK